MTHCRPIAWFAAWLILGISAAPDAMAQQGAVEGVARAEEGGAPVQFALVRLGSNRRCLRGIDSHPAHIDEIRGRGDTAFVAGHSTIIPDGGGSPVVVGRYLDIRLRQAYGTWLFYRDMVSPVSQPSVNRE